MSRASFRQQRIANPIYGGGASAIETLDAFAAEAGLVTYPAPSEKRKVRSGEHRMALRMIKDAIAEAGDPRKPRACAEAREWLRDGLRLFSARVCFESLDMEYETALARLEAQWAAMDAKAKVKR